LSVIVGATAQAETVVFKMAGSVPSAEVGDSLTLTKSGAAQLETRFPSIDEGDAANTIGKFKTQLPPATYAKFVDLMKKIRQIYKPSSLTAYDAVKTELGFDTDKTPMVWTNGQYPELSKQLNELFFATRKKILKYPERALSLDCDKVTGKISCHLSNPGSATVTTVDPLDVPGALACVPELGIREYVKEPTEMDPLRMKPKKISIGPKSKWNFSFNYEGFCKRLSVKTAVLKFNAKYRDSLTGELISNPLE